MKDDIESGRPVPVQLDWLYHLYYPSRRQHCPASASGNGNARVFHSSPPGGTYLCLIPPTEAQPLEQVVIRREECDRVE